MKLIYINNCSITKIISIEDLRKYLQTNGVSKEALKAFMFKHNPKKFHKDLEKLIETIFP